MTTPGTALVLAGQRAAAHDTPAARAFPNKAFIPVGGVPMIARVLKALGDSGRFAHIVVATGNPDAVRALPALPSGVTISFISPAGSPASTVMDTLDRFAGPWPLLVTTADHALLDQKMITHFLDHAPPGADVTAGLVEATLVRQHYPETERTYLRFRDGAVKGANLFLIGSAGAGALLNFWRKGERHRKSPWRLVARIGPLTALRFLLGRFTLADALAALGARTHCRLAAVKLPFAEAAFDVDDADDLAFAERTLKRGV